MKKTSTLALSLLLAAGAWCGLAYAAEGDTPASGDQKTATFDFTGDVEGLTATKDNNAKNVTEFSMTQDDVKLDIAKTDASKTTGGVRLWIASETKNQLRAYQNTTLTLSIEDGEIQEVSLAADKGLNNVTTTAFTKAEGSTATAATYTGTGSKVDFTITGTVQFTSIVVKYTVGTPEVPDTRKEPNLQTNAQPEYTVVLGSNWYGPYFYTDPYGIEIQYTSSNPEVVSINEWGQPELKAVGEATITATTAETEEYKSVSKSYKVTVLPEGTVFNSKMGEEFDKEEPWTINTQYNCLYANSFISAGKYQPYDKAMATSPQFAVDKNSSATLTFDSAIGYISDKTASDYCKVFVAVVEKEDNPDPDFGGYDPNLYDGEETAAELNWVEFPNVIETPTDGKNYTWVPVTIDLGTEYAGKTIKIGFQYSSVSNFGCGWEVKNIQVICTDLLKPLKDAAIEEVLKYGNLLGENLSEWSVQGWKRTIKDCTSEDEINEAIEYIFKQITDQVYRDMEMNFTWTVNTEGQLANYVADAAEGVSPWQAGEFSLNSLFNCQRVHQGGITPWAADAKSADEASEDAFYIQNVATGLYVAAPTTVGAPIAATDDQEKAGIFVLKCTQDVIALTDDASGLFISFDATKGMTLSETATLIKVDALNTWEKEGDYSLAASFPGSYKDEYNSDVIDEITTIQVAVSVDAEVSGIGGIILTTRDSNTYEEITLERFSSTAIASMTPKKGQGYNIEYEAGQEVLVPFEANIYTFALREKITAGGYYSLTVDEGTFVVETKDGKVFSPEAYASVEIPAAETEGFAPVVTPEAGKVDQLDKICIQPVDDEFELPINWNCGANIVLSRENEIVAEWTKDQVNEANVRDIDDFFAPDQYELVLETPVTADGTYVLTIPAEFFENANGNFSGLTEITWTIGEGSSQITDIKVNGRSVMFDLQGRRINGNARGIVISNGKKILVK